MITRTRRWAVEQVACPVPGEDEVLVRVCAAGLNRADLLMRDGSYVPDDGSWTVAADRVGFEMAGIVAEVGPGVDGVGVGDRVMAQVGGACAELVVVDHRLLLPVPEHLSTTDAAGMPSAALTSYDALIGPGRLRGGDRVLVTGATSGVGLLAVQVATALGASFVVGTTRSDERAPAVVEAGADATLVSTRAEEWSRFRNPDHRFDVILDHVGGHPFADVVRVAGSGGRIVQVGRLGGSRATIDLELVARRRLTVTGTTFRGRELDELMALTRALCDVNILEQLRPRTDHLLDLDDIETAANHLTRGDVLGKVVVSVEAP